MSLIFDMERSIRKFASVDSNEDRMLLTLQIFMELFPVTRSILLRYSPLGHVAEGIISYDESEGIGNFRSFREDIRSYPGVYSAIRERKAKFISEKDYLKGTSSKSVTNSNSFLVVPVVSGTHVVGYIHGSKYKDGASFDDEMLHTLTRFGKLIGNFFENNIISENNTVLSKRELEVMYMIANGESNKEIAESLAISEFTVKQYVKTAIQKLGVQNRAHGVAELLRKEIIT